MLTTILRVGTLRVKKKIVFSLTALFWQIHMKMFGIDSTVKPHFDTDMN